MKIDIRNLSEDQLIDFFKEKGLTHTGESKYTSGYGKNPLIPLMR